MRVVKFMIMMTGEFQQKKYVFKKKQRWVYINCNVHVLADSKKN